MSEGERGQETRAQVIHHATFNFHTTKSTGIFDKVTIFTVVACDWNNRVDLKHYYYGTEERLELF